MQDGGSRERVACSLVIGSLLNTEGDCQPSQTDFQHAVCGKVVYAQVFRDPRLGLLLSMCYRNSLKNGSADLENGNVLKSETPQRMVSLRHNNVHFLKNSLKKFHVSIFISVVFDGFVDCNWLSLDSKGRKRKS